MVQGAGGGTFEMRKASIKRSQNQHDAKLSAAS